MAEQINSQWSSRVLSYGQVRLWALERFGDNSGTYVIPVAYRLSGDLDIDALEDTFRIILERHEPLRTRILNENGQPAGYVVPLSPEHKIIHFEEHFEVDDPLSVTFVAQVIDEEITKKFDFECDLMLRVRIVKTAPSHHVLLLVIHHVAADGLSLGILLEELALAYSARKNRELPLLQDLPVSYADYAAWQREFLNGDELAEQIDYWRQELSGLPESLQLPSN